MSAKFLKSAVGIPIYLAREVAVKGLVVAYRLVDAIDPEHRDQAGETVASAVGGNKLFSAEQKKKISAIEITFVPP